MSYILNTTKNISDNVLTLPMYADLKFEDVDRICDIILTKNRGL